MQAILALEDGRIFHGKGYGAKGECYGEVVFNTSGIRRHFHFDLVREHARSAGNRGAIATRLADDRGRLASDCGLVYRGDAIDNFSIRRHEFSRGYQNYVSGTQLRTLHLLRAVTLHDAVRDGLCTRLPKCVGLRFAATLGHGFGKVGEQHGEPQPQCDLQIKAKILGIAEQQNGGEHTANFHDEHDRVTHHVTWIQLDKRIQDRAPHDLALPDRFRFRFISCHVEKPQNVLPAAISRCSRIGPRLSAGKNVNAPTIRITPISSTVNSGVVTGNVPSDGGTYFFCARLPAIASMGMIIRKRPISMVKPMVVLYQSVLGFKPPNAEPLLPAPETNAYNIWLKPCGPGLEMLEVPKP